MFVLHVQPRVLPHLSDVPDETPAAAPTSEDHASEAVISEPIREEITEDFSSPAARDSNHQDIEASQEHLSSSHAGQHAAQSFAMDDTPTRKGKIFKTKDGRRMTGRKVLNSKVLIKVLGVVNKYDNSKWFKVRSRF